MGRLVHILTYLSLLLCLASADVQFHTPLFADGMILQRGVGTKVWGIGATPKATVTVKVQSLQGGQLGKVSSPSDARGSWTVSLPDIYASVSTVVTVSDGSSTARLTDVAFGDVLLCGGQSNMGFGMCGTNSKSQTNKQALDALPPLRFFFQAGSGPAGGSGRSICKNSAGEESVTPNQHWFTANASNSGGASAVCMLTAQELYHALDGKVPVGAVESCIGGTNVEPWTPPSGSLWKQHMQPLLPMRFVAALWDQGEADAKRTNSTWYATEFPTMITGWRSAFQTANLPFFYVELCTEYGAEEPKEPDFWLAQRSALKLPFVGFAVTTDIQRALHPPDKQDVAYRLGLELLREVYGHSVVSRGPELISATVDGDDVIFKFSNSSLTSHAGIVVGNEASCQQSQGHDSVAMDPVNKFQKLNYTIKGSKVTVHCAASDGMVQLNSDQSQCFLYGPTGLPAPPVQHSCKANSVGAFLV